MSGGVSGNTFPIFPQKHIGGYQLECHDEVLSMSTYNICYQGEIQGKVVPNIILTITSPHLSLRKQAYSNILKILPPKNENFQIKILIFFHISAQNIDCGYLLELPR